MDSKYQHRHRKFNYKSRRKKGYKKMNRKAGFFRIILDLILGCMTGGIWWIYLFIRYIRKNG